MGTTTPLRISDELVNAARNTAALLDRSITGQLEFWAKLGRVIEATCSNATVISLQKAERVADIAKLVSQADTPEGRQLAKEEISRHGTPLYGTDPAHPGLIVEKRPDGSRRLGRFINRQFVVTESTATS